MRARGWLRRPQRRSEELERDKERERKREQRRIEEGRERGRGKEEPGARKTNGEGGHLRKTEERHHLIPSSYLCISRREFVRARALMCVGACVAHDRTHTGASARNRGKEDGQFRDALMGSP